MTIKSDQRAYAVPDGFRSRLRRRLMDARRRVRAWVLEDGKNGEGGMPNKWATSPRWTPGHPETDGVWMQAAFCNDASDIHIIRKWERGDEPRIAVQMRCSDFRRVALWYLWRWGWGEWFGLRRWLYYRWLFAHMDRWRERSEYLRRGAPR